METKICSHCKEQKPIDKFRKNKSTKDALSYQCKDCDGLSSAKWRKENLEKCKQSFAKWRNENFEKDLERCKKWRKENPEKHKQSTKKWRKENPEKLQKIQAREVLNLTNAYVVSRIRQPTKLSLKTIKNHPEIIEIKRALIKFNRIIRA